jgi:hypothetical protein
LKDEKIQNGLAFIIGFLGLKLVELIADNLFKKINKK